MREKLLMFFLQKKKQRNTQLFADTGRAYRAAFLLLFYCVPAYYYIHAFRAAVEEDINH